MGGKCLTCPYAIWRDGVLIACQRDDCVNGVVQYDD